MTNKGINVIQTAAGSPAAAAIILELKKAGIRVIGLDCDPLSAGFYLADKFYVIPRGNAPEFLGEILRICETEKPKAILIGPEEELIVLSQKKDLFFKKGVLLLCPDYNAVGICTDKLKCQKSLNSLGIPVPEIYNENDAEFPCIIKPRFGRGGKDVYRVDNKSELRSYFQNLQQPIIQKYISGIEYTVDVLADLRAKPLSIVPRIRLQVESGISMKGKTVYDDEIITFCRKIVDNFKLVGPSCIQCIRNSSGVKFIEINLRFCGGSALSFKADPTIISNLIKMIRGENTTASTGFEAGLTMLRYYSEVFIPNSVNA